MRQWLWTDFLKNTSYFANDYLWLHCLISVISVYVVCTILEIIRHHLIEKPIFNRINKRNKHNISHTTESQNKNI